MKKRKTRWVIIRRWAIVCLDGTVPQIRESVHEARFIERKYYNANCCRTHRIVELRSKAIIVREAHDEKA